jgi:hypothetical protein
MLLSQSLLEAPFISSEGKIRLVSVVGFMLFLIVFNGIKVGIAIGANVLLIPLCWIFTIDTYSIIFRGHDLHYAYYVIICILLFFIVFASAAMTSFTFMLLVGSSLLVGLIWHLAS